MDWGSRFHASDPEGINSSIRMDEKKKKNPNSKRLLIRDLVAAAQPGSAGRPGFHRHTLGTRKHLLKSMKRAAGVITTSGPPSASLYGNNEGGALEVYKMASRKLIGSTFLSKLSQSRRTPSPAPSTGKSLVTDTHHAGHMTCLVTFPGSADWLECTCGYPRFHQTAQRAPA